MMYTPRYSVCRPGVPPVEMRAFSDREEALSFAIAERGEGLRSETWDWAENAIIDGAAS